MTPDELAKEQFDQAASALFSLAERCRRRFLRSADLVGMGGDVIAGLRAFGVSEGVNLTPLVDAWQCLCKRYLDERYDPQMTLFQKHGESLLEAWGQFVYWHVFPKMVREDEVLRNVLRALGALPCQSPRAAAEAVRQYLMEVTFPGERPRWAPKEDVD